MAEELAGPTLADLELTLREVRAYEGCGRSHARAHTHTHTNTHTHTHTHTHTYTHSQISSMRSQLLKLYSKTVSSVREDAMPPAPSAPPPVSILGKCLTMLRHVSGQSALPNDIPENADECAGS